MFDIAQIDARSLQLHLQQVHLGNMIQEVCRAQSKAGTDRKLSLCIELPILPNLKADPNSLRKVFQHLVNNAVKFTPDGGKVTVTGHVIDVCRMICRKAALKSWSAIPAWAWTKFPRVDLHQVLSIR